jgi:hypothetical protein
VTWPLIQIPTAIRSNLTPLLLLGKTIKSTMQKDDLDFSGFLEATVRSLQKEDVLAFMLILVLKAYLKAFSFSCYLGSCSMKVSLFHHLSIRCWIGTLPLWLASWHDLIFLSVTYVK